MLDFIFGSSSDRFVKSCDKVVKKILSLEGFYSSKSDEELSQMTQDFKKRLKEGETLDDILPEAFGVVREVAFRTLGIKHYPVQLVGGISLHKGNISQMKTGEGKTLVATLAVYLNALEEKGVHIVTVNDYLARRDTDWMGQIYSFLGMSVGVINGEGQSYLYDKGHKELDKSRDELGSYKIFYEFLKPCKRKEAYTADITYGTNSEFGFDYLRDNIVYSKDEITQRGFNYSIIDEADSILIDESRSPLIISSPSETPISYYEVFSKIAKQMVLGEDYEIDEKTQAVSMKESGISKVEKALGIDNIYTDKTQDAVHGLNNALIAKSLKRKNKEYIVRSSEVVIVDVFTGRLMPGRRWGNGLHQAIEAKEGLKIQRENRTLASITYQNYFRMYGKLSGMTGTAESSQEEFYKVYGLQVYDIPTNKPIQRIDDNDLLYIKREEKEKAILNKVKELQERGQPVLIGTTSIDNNEKLSKKLKKAKIQHTVLNAKNNEKEGEVISNAGQKGKVTVATNLAGRGVDIVLGGLPYSEEKHKEICELGGLFVLGTERHEARRIDDQLRGRSGRQGDPGRTQFFVSLDDDLVRIFGSDKIQGLIEKLNLPTDQVVNVKFLSGRIRDAQNKVEGHNFDARKYQLQYDSVLNKQRKDFYEKRRSVLFSEDLGDVWKDYITEDLYKDFEEKNVLDKLQFIILKSLDISWINHLGFMEHARSSTGLRAYGQKEPMMEYKKEAKDLYSDFYGKVSGLVEINTKNYLETLKNKIEETK